MDFNFLGFIFIAICFLGFYLAYLYGRKTRKFRWSEYLAIIILPLFCVAYLSIFVDLRILNLFLLSGFVGFLLEYAVGLTFHKTLNIRLWEYKFYSIDGYTSLLTIPVWSIAGIVFWLFSLQNAL